MSVVSPIGSRCAYWVMLELDEDNRYYDTSLFGEDVAPPRRVRMILLPVLTLNETPFRDSTAVTHLKGHDAKRQNFLMRGMRCS